MTFPYSWPWIALLFAGLLEVCWAVGLKYTVGFRRPVPSAIWVGIGAFGAAILGIALFGEPVTLARMGFLALLLVSIVGLKVTS